MSKSKAVAKKEKVQVPSTIDENVPDHLRGTGTGAGVEGTTNNDVDIPRVILVQSTSPQIEEGAEAGQFYHSVLEESVGKEITTTMQNGKTKIDGYSLEIVPLSVSSDYVLWNPRDNGGGILDRAPLVNAKKGLYRWNNPGETYEGILDKKAGTKFVWKTGELIGKDLDLAVWGTQDPNGGSNKPAATLTYYILAMLPQHLELGPVLIILQRTQVKAAKKVIGRLRLSANNSNLDIYTQKFILRSYIETRNDNSFRNIKADFNGYIGNDDVAIYKPAFEGFRGFNLSDDALSAAQSDAETANTGDVDTGDGEF